MTEITLMRASAHETTLPDASVHCIVTSPPYYGLRSYDGAQAIDWPEVTYAPMDGLDPITIQTMTCGLGEEPTPEAYIGHLVLVMREMWRALRDDGTAWVNLGDSYAGSGGAGGDYNAGGIKEGQPKFKPPKSELRAKSKILIPHRFALAMQAEGWIVRQDIVWAKGISCLPDYAGSCMPESVQDRPTNGHEYVFLLAKQGRYFYDAEAVKEGSMGQTGQAVNFARESKEALIPGQNATQHRNGRKPTYDNGTRNLRSVWALNPGSYPGAHFATFPERLPELMVLAGTSAKGVCPECAAPWERVVERTGADMAARYERGEPPRHGNDGAAASNASGVGRKSDRRKTSGWQPTCDCDAGAPMPATVLDPFNGAGTTGLVAMRHNRDYIGIDLSDAYFQQTRDRLARVQIALLEVLT